MRKSAIIMIVVTGFCLVTPMGWAALYVSDRLEVPLYNGPGTQYRIVSMLRSGQTVEVLAESSGWNRVRLVGGTDTREGWILTRYLMNREPWENRVQALEAENTRLRETASPMARELRDMKAMQADLETELRNKTAELSTVREAYETLREEASEFLELKKTFGILEGRLLEAEAERVRVARENERLRSSDSYRWFLSGSGVLLAGLLVGLLMGRRQKTRTLRFFL
ncbi:MAG: TIGR04211 family SH3 domain-containing protein [Syntrophales bacterium]|nr:TIGR04211 family SH3 domain-containing protein [Syntrophales bacterium]MCK9527976.1 TIGR04211 family SH3 domain-containing protein [Syntrophales bacterium]MDX9921448.1 TIGR04211 family SH3 domain-containing protein [Syntrophales bacterium]